jgi:hypothetical protein
MDPLRGDQLLDPATTRHGPASQEPISGAPSNSSRRLKWIVVAILLIGMVIGWFLSGLVFYQRFCDVDARYSWNWITHECIFEGIR